MDLQVRIDPRAVQAAIGQIGRETPAAVSRSLNRAASGVRTQASREVRQSYAIRARDIASDVIAVEKSTTSSLAAQVRIRGKAIALAAFGAPRQTRRGVTVTVKKGAGRQLYPRAFLAQGRGGQQVFWRTRAGGKLVPRGPIKMLFGPSVAQIVSAKPFTARLLKSAYERIATELAQQVRYRIGKRG